ncbi:hypothetical protein NL676_038795 [Syzygium grande]|nr:hypothetical protein NL676_038795 [Syzygium grande]
MLTWLSPRLGRNRDLPPLSPRPRIEIPAVPSPSFAGNPRWVVAAARRRSWPRTVVLVTGYLLHATVTSSMLNSHILLSFYGKR